MRFINSAVTTFLSLLICSSVMSSPCQAQNFTVTNYQFISQSPVTATQWQVVYKADLVNGGAVPFASVTGQLTSLNPFSFRTITGENQLTWAPVPANSQVTSSNTFTILVDRSQPFSFNNLSWTFSETPVAPVANAGASQTVALGGTATLNGSGSTNPSGIGTLTYAWAFVSRPFGSVTTLAHQDSVNPSFLVDVAGNYLINSRSAMALSVTRPPRL